MGDELLVFVFLEEAVDVQDDEEQQGGRVAEAEGPGRVDVVFEEADVPDPGRCDGIGESDGEDDGPLAGSGRD